MMHGCSQSSVLCFVGRVEIRFWWLNAVFNLYRRAPSREEKGAQDEREAIGSRHLKYLGIVCNMGWREDLVDLS